MDYKRLVAAMSTPDFYPHHPDDVQLIETHISTIFVAGAYVYKVKKAVDFGFLDFTSLEKRKHFCEEELRLNRRLAPATYLDVVTISEDDAGTIFLSQAAVGKAEGKKTVVEYAVRMRLLPRDRMLKALLARGAVEPSAMDAIAAKVAAFHRHTATGGRIDLMGDIEVIRKNHDENFEETEQYIGITIQEYAYRFITSYADNFLNRQKELLARRVKEHRIRECHGDLHLDHICLSDDIIIFDCIEFNERFRYTDVAAEAAFFSMDLDYNGYPEHARSFVNAYIREAGDPDVSRLLNFYRCYYAYVRGKVISFRTNHPAIRPQDREEALQQAARYFDLAYNYAARPEKPALILVLGLMGTGKSALAMNLAPRIDAEVIRTDVLRKELLHIRPEERHYEGFGRGIYAEDISRRTYEQALAGALEKIRRGASVIIDASFKRQDERVKAYEAARAQGTDFFIVECICREDIIRKRLEARGSRNGAVSDGRWEIYHAQKNDFHAVTGFPPGIHLIVDTSAKPKTYTHDVIEHIWKFGRK